MQKYLPFAFALVILPATVTTAQVVDGPQLVGYARLGQSMVFADDVRSAPGFGFGFRTELETLAIDVSFLNMALDAALSDATREMAAGSMLKIQALRFLSSDAPRSAYLGGGLSWGVVSVGRSIPAGGGATSWHGSGLQGELTIGYELARDSPLRFFVQAEASAPFFNAHSDTFAYPRAGSIVNTGRQARYIPSVVVSAGVGWQGR